MAEKYRRQLHVQYAWNSKRAEDVGDPELAQSGDTAPDS
jgi:hypothetical protein